MVIKQLFQRSLISHVKLQRFRCPIMTNAPTCNYLERVCDSIATTGIVSYFPLIANSALNVELIHHLIPKRVFAAKIDVHAKPFLRIVKIRFELITHCVTLHEPAISQNGSNFNIYRSFTNFKRRTFHGKNLIVALSTRVTQGPHLKQGLLYRHFVTAQKRKKW